MPRKSPASNGSNYGTGSVYQRGDGKWVAAVSLSGKRIVRYGATEREAKQKLADLQRENYTGTLTAPTRTTLGGWIQEWLGQREAELRPSTLRTYRLVLMPVAKAVGHVRLDKLTPALIAHTLADLRKKGMGSRRVQMAHAYLHACIQRAVDLGLVGHNPCDKVAKPKHEAQERAYWDVGQMRAFLAVALDDRHQHTPLLAFLLGSGLRFGEAIGLRWADVDLARGSVHVRRAMVWEGNSVATLQRPKTRQGDRVIALPDFCVEMLTAMPRPLDSQAAIFVTRTNTLPSQSVVGEALVRLCDLAGVPRINVHGLRHAHAALLLAEGLDLQALRRRLGHATVDMSVNRYAYALRPDEQAALAVGRVLGVGHHSEGGIR